VHGLEGERLEDEHLECPLEELGGPVEHDLSFSSSEGERQ
jgi:hypothetical protein